jgi:putative sigma-54 modulation protein
MDKMKINIVGEKSVISGTVKEYIKEKLSKLNKYFKSHENITTRVVAKVKGHQQFVEITVFMTNFTLRGEEVHSDLYAAVDLVIDKLESQIRKNKTKLQSKKFKNINKDFSFDYEIDDIFEEKTKVVRRKKIELKPMDEAEAILQIDMLDHDFFIYKNVEDNKIYVLYKRKDGNYGIIETI